MQPHSDSISETNTDDDQVGELGGKWVRGRSSRRNRKWKDAQRLANKISTIFKKPGKHSRDNSPSHSGSSQHSNMCVSFPNLTCIGYIYHLRHGFK